MPANIKKIFLEKSWPLPVTILLLLFPALFVNLGFLPLDLPTDEGRRALVALEMMLSGDYITPTLNGELYFNKPPLYNWIIAASFQLWNEISMFALRFPVVIGLLLYGLTMFFFLKKHFDWLQAFIITFFFITCGRIFFYDSFLGLIDITYSWATFSIFMLTFHFYEKKRFYALFLVTYLLTAIGFLMKGLPSLVFQAITLLVIFSYNRRFWKLVSVEHALGILLLFSILGTYYYFYFTVNDSSPETVANVLWGETTKRTVVRFGVLVTIAHILTFPVEMLYHFAPWTVLVIFLFRKDLLQQINRHPFIKFCAYTFFFNIIVYWTSPEVYPRYLHMLAPLVFIVYGWLLFNAPPAAWQIRVLKPFLLVVAILVSIAPLVFPFVKVLQDIPHAWPKSLVLFGGLAFATWLYYQANQMRGKLLAFLLLLMVARIGFNWFILPPRLERRKEIVNHAITVGKMTKGEPLYVLQDAPVFDASTFYIERERGEVLKFKNDIDPGTFYIARPDQLQGKNYEEFYRFRILFYNDLLRLVKFPANGPK